MIRQIGALPYQLREEGLRILLVTSRESGRWVIPKGNPMLLLEPHEAAAREAFEEGGIEGVIEATPIGAFRYRKRWRLLLPVRAEVRVFPMRVERELDDWPERGQRQRRWYGREDAAAAVAEPGLKRIILDFEP